MHPPPNETNEHRTDGERGVSRLPPLRVLCLHDENSNASLMQTDLAELARKLEKQHGVELVYMNAPLLSPPIPKRDSDDCQVSGTPVQEFDDEHASFQLNNGSEDSLPGRAWYVKEIATTSGVDVLLSPHTDMFEDLCEQRENHHDANTELARQTVLPKNWMAHAKNVADPSDHEKTFHFRGLDASLMLLHQVLRYAALKSINFLGVISCFPCTYFCS
jgi:Serine hydrolase (FSH1)